MDNDLSKQLTEQQQKFHRIQQKLDSPELNQIKVLLSTAECRSIGDELLQRPDLFILLLDNPTFALSLTENARAGFLADIQNNPEKIMAILQKPAQINISTRLPEPQQETDLLNDAAQMLGNLYLDTQALFNAYTPSLTNLTDRLVGFVGTLNCDMQDGDPHEQVTERTKKSFNSKKS